MINAIGLAVVLLAAPQSKLDCESIAEYAHDLYSQVQQGNQVHTNQNWLAEMAERAAKATNQRAFVVGEYKRCEFGILELAGGYD